MGISAIPRNAVRRDGLALPFWDRLYSGIQFVVAKRRPKANRRAGGYHNEGDWQQLVNVGDEITKPDILEEGRELPFREEA